jgi:hypothetical protein
MMSPQTTCSTRGPKFAGPPAGLRWTARLLGVGGFLFVLVFAIGQGVPAFWKQPAVVQVEFVATAVMLAGLLAGWKWEWRGAFLIAAGWLMFLVAEKGWPPLLFTLFLVVAALYAWSGYSALTALLRVLCRQQRRSIGDTADTNFTDPHE